MANSLEAEQELSEDLLWDASDDEQHAASSEEPEQPPAPSRSTDDFSRRQKGLDIAGTSACTRMLYVVWQ